MAAEKDTVSAHGVFPTLFTLNIIMHHTGIHDITANLLYNV